MADTWNSYFLFGVEPAPPTFDTGHWYLELMGRKLRQGVDDLASVFPSFASEWHESKNGDTKPSDVFASSALKVWWQCDLGHEWQARIGDRTSYKTGCPYCANRKVLTGFNDLAFRHPAIAAEWNLGKNTGIAPNEVHYGSKKRIHWKCREGHEWLAAIQSRTSADQGCPVCSNHLVVAGVNDLEATHPNLAAEWHPTLNLNVTPKTVVAGTAKKIWWQCAQGHEWRVSGNQRITYNSGCPVCSNKKVQIGVNDLETLAPEISKRWHPTMNGGTLPTGITVGSNKKFWWLCEFGHPWNATVSSLSSPVRAQGCGVCAGKIVLSGVNDLATIRPDLVTEWDFQKNGDLNPTLVTAASHRKAWWKCNVGHEWQATITNRNGRNSQCPGCATGGYDSSQAGVIYFISNRKLLARKIGITNVNAKNDRISNWKKNGWDVVASFESQSGRAILETETSILGWIRRVHKLPAYLSNQDMGKMAGWSETFSAEGPSDREIADEIQNKLSEFSASEVLAKDVK